MSSEQYSNELLSAMSIIANRAVETAGYDKTIKAIIVQCQDATIERYKVQYQDGYWTAYGNGSGVSYTKGTPVYILIPNGDMSQRKTILGSVKQLGINYINIPTQENKYSENGNNILTKQRLKYELCSYKTEKQVIFGGENNINDISISLRAASTYIKQSSHLKCSFRIQTKIPIDQRYSGNYGIKFYLDFKDRTTNNIVTRQYIFDTYLMTGNPYLYNNTVLQTASFQIDGPRFEKISKIELFVENFPNVGTGIQPNDIFISNLDIKGVTLLSQEQMDKVSLSFVAKKGYIFTDNGNKDQSRKIQAVVRVLGKTVTDVAGQDLKFYWFIQNISITQNSIYYNKYGGSGWRCLNKYKVLKTNTEGKPTKIEFNSGSSSFSVKKEDVLIKNQKYKCVVLYGDTILQKEFTMINDAAGYTINITSDKGTSFTLDSGYPNLTCKISDTNGKVPSGIKYHWGVVNYQGVFSNLVEDSDNYKKWQTDLENYNELKNNLNNKTIYRNDKYKNTNKKNIDVYNELKDQIKTWNKTEIVYQNFIYHVNIKNIVNFSAFICTVIDKNNNVIGSAEITLTNKSSSNDGYFLRLNNGKQVFNYNQQGLSPCKNPKVKYIIPELSFSLYNDKNQEIDQDEINTDNIKWFIPNPNNSLLTCNYKNGETSGDMIIYSGRKTFIYGILNRYIKNHNINNIQLQVKYHGYTLTAETNFTFTKQGYSGTNGTGVTVRIVPIDINGVEINQLPYYNNGAKNFNKLITEVYKGGEKVEDYSCVWSTLINKNSKEILKIDKNNAITGLTLSSCEIIKVAVSIGGKTIYATLPIIYCTQENKYRISLKQNTGYQYVYYAEDGTNPQYDNKYPFTFIIEKEINGTLQDVSTNTQFIKDNTFKYSTFGNLTSRKNVFSKQNSIKIEPVSYYNGDNVINYVECVVYENTKNVATCRVPIHMMLNRYGHAALNDWDGNSIDISNQQTILAPQVGAGQKEKDNSFTGILIGSVKDNTKSSISNGLFGYSKGKRTIFLDSSSGKATFGLDKKGRIEIDGSSAIITGGDYQLKDEKKKIAGSGMQIDLGEPSINFGNKKFSVNKDGALTSISGKIAGWNISEDDLTKGTVGMSSDSSTGKNIAFWAGNESRTKAPFKVDFNGALTSISGKIAGWNINENSLTKGKVGISSNDSKDTNTAFWAGSSDNTNAPFRVDFGGNLVVNSGKIGNGENPIYIGGRGRQKSGTLYSGTHNNLESTAKGFYLGTDGISFGGFFKMDASGKLTAKSGKIANWNFDVNAIYNDEVKNHSKPTYANDKGKVYGRGIYFGKGGLRMGENFHVNENGDLYARSGYFQGTLYSSEGEIGGWEIKPTLLKGGNMQINSNGSMKGSNWSIDSNGKANFSNMNISGGTISGGSRTGGSIKGGSINPSSVACGDYKNMDTWVVNEIHAQKAWITDLIVKNLKAENLTLHGKKVHWRKQKVCTSASIDSNSTTVNGVSVIKSVNGNFGFSTFYLAIGND